MKEVLVLIALVIAILIGGIFWGMARNEEWETFVRENNCHKTLDVSRGNAERAGYSEGWLCADGVTYYR